jgi:predicted permease
MDTLIQDLRMGVRAIRRAPGFALVATLIVALGVGAASAVFATMDALLLRPLPVHEPGRLVSLSEELGTEQRSFFSYPQYLEYRDRTASALDLAASAHTTLSVRVGELAEARMTEFATGNYFDVLGIRPALGRWVTPADDAADAEPVAVISYELWQSQFGGHPDAIGRTVQVNGTPLTVVGVAGPDFRGVLLPVRTELWVPVANYPRLVPSESDFFLGWDNLDWLVPFGRLAPGISVVRAGGVVDAAAHTIAADFPVERVVTGGRLHRMTGLPVSLRAPVAWFFALLLATAALLLFVASVNVSGMLLARAPGRRREMAVRVAVGAGRGRLMRMLMTESAVLFALGGAGGVMIAIWMTAALRSVSTPFLDAGTIGVAISPDWRVFTFALAISLAAGALAGLAPAVGASRPELLPTLKEGGTGSGRRRSRLRDATVIAQIAASLVLLVAAGLLVRALQSAASTDTGFDPRDVWTAALNLDPHGYEAADARLFFSTLTERLAGLPGVAEVAIGRPILLGYGSSSTRVRVPDGPGGEPLTRSIDFTVVDRHFLSTLRVPLIAGRGFEPTDVEGSTAVAVINQEMARSLWGAADPIGRTFLIGTREWTVIGVTTTGRYRSLDEAPTPFLYLPFEQTPGTQMAVYVRTAPGAPDPLAAMRREVQAIDRDLPLLEPAALSDRIAVATFPHRAAAVLTSAFGAIGLLLAAIGIYGVMAFAVSQRTREIGIRLALGARRGDVLALVMRGVVPITAMGLALGMLIALAVTRVVAGSLFGVEPADPVTFLAVGSALTTAALLATYIPARRAARVQPVVALRAD